MSKQKYTSEELANILEEQGIHIEEVGRAMNLKRVLQNPYTLTDIFTLLDYLPSLSKDDGKTAPFPYITWWCSPGY